MEGRSSSRSTSSAWNAGFVGVDCGSVVIVGTHDPIRSVHSASTSVPARDDSASDSTRMSSQTNNRRAQQTQRATITIGGDDDALCYGGEHSTRSPRRRARADHRIDRSSHHPSSRRAPPPPSRPPRGLLNDVDAIIEDPHPRCIPSRSSAWPPRPPRRDTSPPSRKNPRARMHRTRPTESARPSDPSRTTARSTSPIGSRRRAHH